MLGAGGVDEARIVAEAGTQPLHTPDDFWTVAQGWG